MIMVRNPAASFAEGEFSTEEYCAKIPSVRKSLSINAPGRTRTCNPRFRSYSGKPEILADTSVTISMDYIFSFVFQGFSTSLVRKLCIEYFDTSNYNHLSRTGYTARRADGKRPSIQDAGRRRAGVIARGSLPSPASSPSPSVGVVSGQCRVAAKIAAADRRRWGRTSTAASEPEPEGGAGFSRASASFS
jgi:hypothetical protein